MKFSKRAIQKRVVRMFDLTHGGTVYNIVQRYFSLYKTDEDVEKGDAISWDRVITVINRDPERFLEWLKDREPEDFNLHLENQHNNSGQDLSRTLNYDINSKKRK
jgi:hypothetical protein